MNEPQDAGEAYRASQAQGITRVDRYVIAALVCVSIIAAANILMDGLKGAVTEYRYMDFDVNRWTVHQEYSDGTVIFDSKKGRLCVIPKAGNANQSVNCTSTPPEN